MPRKAASLGGATSQVAPPAALRGTAPSDQTTLAALSAAGYESVFDPALSAPSARSVPLTSFPDTTFAGASPTDHNASTSSASSSSSSATHSLAPLLEAADYSASSNFFAGSGQFDPDAPAASRAAGAGPEFDVNNGQPSGDGDISVEFQLQQQEHQEAEPMKGAKGKGKGKGKSVEKNGGGQEEGADASGGDSVKPLKDTKRAAQNRAAQRAFRERKEQHVKDLEHKAAIVESTLAKCTALETRITELDTTVAALRAERQSLILESEAREAERAAWDAERAKWTAEQESWQVRENEWRRECEGLKGALEESRRQNRELRLSGEKREREDADASETVAAKRARP